jgi:ankyrin repeat protein
MGDLEERLLTAAEDGDLQALQECLAAGADPDAQNEDLETPLHRAAYKKCAACVSALLAAGADPNARDSSGWTPLHWVAISGCTDSGAALLATGASPSAASNSLRTPAHIAASANHLPMLRQLLVADPAAALLRTSSGHTLLQTALRYAAVDAARCLLAEAPLQPAGELLAAIEGTPAWRAESRPLLYALVAAHQPLTAAEWARVSTPCAGLGAALPAVLERSVEEAGLLVRHLPRADQTRLRALALSLERCSAACLPPLPTPIVWRLLALLVAE